MFVLHDSSGMKVGSTGESILTFVWFVNGLVRYRVYNIILSFNSLILFVYCLGEASFHLVHVVVVAVIRFLHGVVQSSMRLVMEFL